MRDNFRTALQHVLKWEGGYSDNPLDPGGATNFGITRKTLSNWLGREATKNDVKTLKLTRVEAIYRNLYWEAIRGDEIPSGLDLMVFDCAVNQGPKRAIKILQECLYVKRDGLFGPRTMSALKYNRNPEFLQSDFCTNRALSYVSLITFKTFGLGWLRRLFDTYKTGFLLEARKANKVARKVEPLLSKLEITLQDGPWIPTPTVNTQQIDEIIEYHTEVQLAMKEAAKVIRLLFEGEKP